MFADYKAKQEAKKDTRKDANINRSTKSLIIAQSISEISNLSENTELSLKSANQADLSLINESEINLGYFALATKTSNSDFIIDSGATEHYTFDRGLLLDYTPTNNK